MWKIHRYYLKEIAVNALLTFTVLFGIALISLIYKGIRLVSGGDLIDAAITTLLLAADILPHLLTFSVMFATVLTFARASQEREITALRATLDTLGEELGDAANGAGVWRTIQGVSGPPTADQLWALQRSWEELPALIDEVNAVLTNEMSALLGLVYTDAARPDVETRLQVVSTDSTRLVAGIRRLLPHQAGLFVTIGPAIQDLHKSGRPRNFLAPHGGDITGAGRARAG